MRVTYTSRTMTVTVEQVAEHYDDLDVPYREIWGEHLHHGYWDRGIGNIEDAARALVNVVADAAAIQDGERVVDVGCGYGATARMLARRRGALVVGYTVSKVQFIRAAQVKWDESSSTVPLPRIVLGDWMQNELPASSQDVVLAIESVEHMTDRAKFFSEAARVLRPGGRLVLASWVAKERPFFATRRLLLEPIVREGRLASFPTLSEHRTDLDRAGFVDVDVRDLTKKVRRTWSVCLWRTLGRGLRDANFARDYFFRSPQGRAFVRAMLRIATAYRLGTMRYGLVVARKPGVIGS